MQHNFNADNETTIDSTWKKSNPELYDATIEALDKPEHGNETDKGKPYNKPRF
jgi:hypothetical protein